MAKQTGLLRYSGTMGGVRHFKIKGQQGDFAGLVGGPSGEQVKSAPEFARTRENMNEFGGSAAAAKSVRIGLAQLMRQMSDPQLTGRLTGIMKKINKDDQSEARGYRASLISKQPQDLKGLPLERVSITSQTRSSSLRAKDTPISSLLEKLISLILLRTI